MFKVTSLFGIFFCLVLIIFVESSCKKETNTDCVTSNMSYSKDIKPIFSANGCYVSGCHGSADGVPLDSYATLKVVVDANRLVGSIKQQVGFSKMPKVGNKMSDCDISKVEAWITQGAKDN